MKYFFDIKLKFDNYFNKKNYNDINLIKLLKKNFIQEIFTAPKFIGCGGFYTCIYNTSYFFFLFFLKNF
jgi:hypothetical protein